MANQCDYSPTPTFVCHMPGNHAYSGKKGKHVCIDHLPLVRKQYFKARNAARAERRIRNAGTKDGA